MFNAEKVKNDMKLGIDLGTAFRRMYDRTRISTIYDIANKMALIGEQGVNIVKVFENIEIWKKIFPPH